MTEAPFATTDEPSLTHLASSEQTTPGSPNRSLRLAGMQRLPQTGPTEVPEAGCPTFRNIWDDLTKGGSECLGDVPEYLADIPDVADYLDGSAADRFDLTRAARMLHLIRRSARAEPPTSSRAIRPRGGR